MTHFPLRLLISVYSTLVEAAGMFAALLLRYSHLSKQWNLRERRHVLAPRAGRAAAQAVWLHAASMGESKLLVQFLFILRSKHPGHTYVLTATTRTGVEYLDRCEGEDIAAVGFLPLDTVRLMRSVLSKYRVSRVWLLETELWPCMIWACLTRNVPVGLVNARIEEESLRWYRHFAWLVAPLCSHPDVILAQNQAYADRFAKLGISRACICVTGNLKSYVTVHPLSIQERGRLRGAMGLLPEERCITAGCVHQGEGEVLAQAFGILKLMSFPVKCIVVPRHLKESSEVARELGNGVVRLGEATAAPGWDVCIVEKMGIMEAMYKIADAAFVGGTFDDTGGHNMWDAAQFGIPVVFGPNYRTQQESGDILRAAGVAFSVHDAEGLAHAIVSALRDDARRVADALATFAKETSSKSHNIEDLIP